MVYYAPMLDCWIWNGALHRGYGKIVVRGKRRKAHVIAYETFVGPVPAGFDVHHLCEQKACVNPMHLVALSHGDHAKLHHPGPPEVCRKCGSSDWQRNGEKRRCRVCRNIKRKESQ